MNSFVSVAYVPDTETKIKIGGDGKSIDETDVKWIVSPYDEYALEEALKAKEAKGGTVTALTFGPARADAGLRDVGVEPRDRCGDALLPGPAHGAVECHRAGGTQ